MAEFRIFILFQYFRNILAKFGTFSILRGNPVNKLTGETKCKRVVSLEFLLPWIEIPRHHKQS